MRLSVEDSGPAIPADLLPTLFEPFMRGDLYAQRDGGLALPIARLLSRLMGGELAVDSAPGQGSRFHFKLRFGLQHDALASPATVRRPGMPGTRVLVVDDNATARDVLTGMCTALGLQPDCAVDGLRIEAGRFDPGSTVWLVEPIDRVDVGSGRAVVFDYKTGSKARFAAQTASLDWSDTH